jgi:ACR3 family arsenite efflux pump ArsB
MTGVGHRKDHFGKPCKPKRVKKLFSELKTVDLLMALVLHFAAQGDVIFSNFSQAVVTANKRNFYGRTIFTGTTG